MGKRDLKELFLRLGYTEEDYLKIVSLYGISNYNESTL